MGLENVFDVAGEQLALHCGKLLGGIITTTLKNVVEATLAIILLIRCELRLLHSTVVGVVLLHLLLVPGTSFLTGGSHHWQQKLDPHRARLNHMLLVAA